MVKTGDDALRSTSGKGLEGVEIRSPRSLDQTTGEMPKITVKLLEKIVGVGNVSTPVDVIYSGWFDWASVGISTVSGGMEKSNIFADR